MEIAGIGIRWGVGGGVCKRALEGQIVEGEAHATRRQAVGVEPNEFYDLLRRDDGFLIKAAIQCHEYLAGRTELIFQALTV